MRSSRAIGSAVALAALLMVCSCTPGSATKAGPGTAPVTLTLGTVEQQSNTPYAPEVRAFVDAVSTLSGGALGIEVAWEQAGWVPNAETLVADAVRAGEIDLAFVPTRAFGTFGVHRLDALLTPFLIESPELSSAVVASSTGDAMLSDLEEHGLVGLALIHESMRRPIAYEAALLAPLDYTGVHIRTPESTIAERVISELGGVPIVSTSYHAGPSGERIAAAESAYDWVAALPRGTTATADVVFYPKINVLVASPQSWTALTPEHQEVLRRAAEQARDVGAATTEDESAAAGEYCLAGGALAFAGEEARGQLEHAVSPVRAALEADPVVAADIRAIEELEAATTVTEFVVPWQCRPRRGDWAPWP